MNNDVFLEELQNLGIDYSEIQIDKLEKYYQLLIQENEKYNLTAITDKEAVYLKHFYDSLTIVKAIDLTKVRNLCDIGTGAGFPGIVLKIFFPNLEITLVDSLQKRVFFLNQLIEEINLTGIKAIHDRAEIFARKNYEGYDVVVSRAVANLSMLSELCLPITKIKGSFLAMKGDPGTEIEAAKGAIKKLKGKISKQVEFILPVENSKRTIIVIEKESICPREYPRNYDKIKKQPLK